MKSLHKSEVWQKVLTESHENPVILFKHSNSCPVSADAHNEIKQLERQEVVEDDMYILIVQNSPEISEQIAEELDVKHETPQVLIISDGKAIYHADHGDITTNEVSKHFIDARR
jgi:bacillithiol system protein YtxJ